MRTLSIIVALFFAIVCAHYAITGGSVAEIPGIEQQTEEQAEESAEDFDYLYDPENGLPWFLFKDYDRRVMRQLTPSHENFSKDFSELEFTPERQKLYEKKLAVWTLRHFLDVRLEHEVDEESQGRTILTLETVTIKLNSFLYELDLDTGYLIQEILRGDSCAEILFNEELELHREIAESSR